MSARIATFFRDAALAIVVSCVTTFVAASPALADDQGAGNAAPAGEGAPASSTQTLEIEGVDVRLDFADADFSYGTGPIITWIERSMQIVARYYGRFPTAQLRIRLSTSDGGGVRNGTTFGTPIPFIRLKVGRDVSAQELREDWVLVHEMVHLALPEVGRAHAWLSEGLATYVEGVARVQAGRLAPADLWAGYVHSMPHGLPQSDDEGLDHTHTWGRTYWGGALFCLLADVEIRSRTDNRFGLQDALRAVLQESGGIVSDWPIDRVLATGDTAVGTSTLRDLYAQVKDAPVATDLPALWKRLGIERNGTSVDLRADAPLASIRQAIVRSHAGRAPP